VGEYAEFLAAYPTEALPQQPPAEWRRRRARVEFRPEMADRPVAGVTREEAERFCAWLAAVRFGSLVEVRLPEPVWLQVAAWGPELREFPWNGVGPFGHRDLLLTVWQWTSEEGRAGEEARVFGGSDQLGASPETARASLLRGWPDLLRGVSPASRDPHIGFRVCAVVPPQPAGIGAAP
jgi:formylglycine-generating enzyme required for sulfatase activity